MDEGGKKKEERKEGGQREYYLTLTALVTRQAWQSKAFHYALRLGTIFLAALHTHPPAEHTHTAPQPLSASLPPVSSLCLSVLGNPSPTSQIPSLSKKIFPRAWIAGSHMLRAGTKGKRTAHMQMRRDTNAHTHTHQNL